ncbi:hypothetical protein RO3G_01632 [Rhizopus delemar RA 99-880]|uniref:Uncharacterized protein n=1 Tax=Rhizopus delemar (strain RA 99-880 / ATCC MYA-4621 / FGSC 9543 / NRRL 43880) TaxID=246409 RepID=I1BL48_RHIO9|nr:hypothetical protein RO3G_01632 [Rhizopus delemar RA 99-880]|eukprot:EIE76928.1 hypothetical protein RO3G_01632 [Rhizopus delemar RA 99-880]
METLHRDLKSYIGSLKNQEFTDEELQSLLPQSKGVSENNITTKFQTPIIISANDSTKKKRKVDEVNEGMNEYTIL